METFTVTFKTITPLFLGGANPNESAELRAPSIKAALRFWYRAMNGDLSVYDLYSKESALFGSTDQTHGQSKVKIRISREEHIEPTKQAFPHHPVPGKRFITDILGYLAYGPCENTRVIRSYIKPTEAFSIRFQCDPSVVGEMKDVLQVFVAFGGLGSRSRNGFGSLSVDSKPKIWDREINEILNSQFIKKTADYTAFSKQTKLFKSKKSFDTWDGALADIGSAYRNARLELDKKHTCPKRQYIGAPLDVRGEKSQLERHAKPYFLHVSPINDDGKIKYGGTILFMPYNYCAHNPTISANNKDTVFRLYEKYTNEFNKLLAVYLTEVNP